MDNIRTRSKEQLIHESPILQWNCEESQSGFCDVTDLQNCRYVWNKWDIPISKLSSKTHLRKSHQKKRFKLWLWVLQPEYFQIFQPSTALHSSPKGIFVQILATSHFRWEFPESGRCQQRPTLVVTWFPGFREKPKNDGVLLSSISSGEAGLPFFWVDAHHPPKWSPDGMRVLQASGKVSGSRMRLQG